MTALDAGADAFLSKPIDPLRYVSTVRDLLGTSAYVRSPVWAPVSERLSSGSARLDTVLGGGLPLYGTNLVIGRPGSGKTILAQQYVFHNATTERSGALPVDGVRAAGEDPALRAIPRLLRQVRRRLEGHLRRPRPALNEDGLSGVLGQLTSTVTRATPRCCWSSIASRHCALMRPTTAKFGGSFMSWPGI